VGYQLIGQLNQCPISLPLGRERRSSLRQGLDRGVEARADLPCREAKGSEPDATLWGFALSDLIMR
jgi:hypothetical protein